MARFQVPLDSTGDRDWNRVLRDLLRRTMVDSFTWDPPSVAANSAVDTTLTSTSYSTLSGLRAGCFVAVTPPSDLDTGLSVVAFCGANNSLTLRLRNHTGSTIDQGSGTWTYYAVIP